MYIAYKNFDNLNKYISFIFSYILLPSYHEYSTALNKINAVKYLKNVRIGKPVYNKTFKNPRKTVQLKDNLLSR